MLAEGAEYGAKEGIAAIFIKGKIDKTIQQLADEKPQESCA